MTVINQVFNKTIPVKARDTFLSTQYLSGVLYKDDSWLETAQRECVVFVVDVQHSNPVRSKFEDIARLVVGRGKFFYLAFNYGQSGSSDLPYELGTHTGQSAYHRMAYYGAVVVTSHLSYLANELRNSLVEHSPFTLVSQGGMGLGVLGTVNESLDLDELYTRRMVNNTVLLDPVLVTNNEKVSPMAFAAAWQSVYTGNKCLMLFRMPDTDEGKLNRHQARVIRTVLTGPLIVAPVGDNATPVDWTETQSNLWITHALNHRESDGLTLPNGEAEPFRSGL